MENIFSPGYPYTVHTISVRTGNGPRRVTYRYYERIPYCACPVSSDYQTMNIKVPIVINGKPFDAANSPIWLNILVGGFFAVKNTEDTPVKDSPFTPDGGRKSGRPEQYVSDVDDRDEIALATGFVVVTPGVRGWNCVDGNGVMFGKAPAVVVDYKAAIRFLRHNKDVLWGDTEHIITSGGSAGGAVSALVGATGNDPRYEPYLDKIGAAKERDDVFASACFSPITNLENADAAYEWEFGKLAVTVPMDQGPNSILPSMEKVDAACSNELCSIWRDYLAEEQFTDSVFGVITEENLGEYLCKTVLYSSAKRFIEGLSMEKREAYLNQNPWMHVNGDKISFEFTDYAAHCGRMKLLPAFDDFNKKTPENNVFGTENIRSRHFTLFSLRHDTGDDMVELPQDLIDIRYMMNPMNYTSHDGCCRYWWIRHASSDSHTSMAIPMLLALKLRNSGREVRTAAPWEGWHRADDDPQGVINWVCELAEYNPSIE